MESLLSPHSTIKSKLLSRSPFAMLSTILSISKTVINFSGTPAGLLCRDVEGVYMYSEKRWQVQGMYEIILGYFWWPKPKPGRRKTVFILGFLGPMKGKAIFNSESFFISLVQWNKKGSNKNFRSNRKQYSKRPKLGYM